MDIRPFKQGGPLRAFFDTLFGKATPIEQQPPYNNDYSRGQQLAPFVSDFEPNPYRRHAPPVPLVPEDTVVVQDRANTALQRVPDQPLQQYFNEQVENPLPPPSAPIHVHGVQVPMLFYKRGWSQQYVPSTGRRMGWDATTPAVQLSRSAAAYAPTYVDIGARSPIKGKAPKAR